jgi:WD40 repeat protein
MPPPRRQRVLGSGILILGLAGAGSSIWSAAADPPVPGAGPPPPAAKLLWTVPDIGYPEGFSADGLTLFTLRNENRATHLVGRDLRRALAAGRYFVCESADNQGKVVALDLHSGQEWRWDLSGRADARYFRVSPTGDYFTRFNGHWQTHLVELRTGRTVLTVGDVDGSHFTADGRFYCYHGREESGSVLRIWDLAARKVVATIPDLWGCPVPSPDGRFLVVPTCEPVTSPEDRRRKVNEGSPGHLAVWDLPDLRRKAVIPWKKLDFQVNHFRARFSPDGRVSAVWDWVPGPDKTVQFWDLSSGQRLWTVEITSFPFEGDFSADSSKFVIFARDKPILRLLDVPGRRQVWQSEVILDHGPLFYFTGDSRHLVLPNSTALV